MTRDSQRDIFLESELTRVSAELEEVDRQFKALNAHYNTVTNEYATLMWKYDLLLDKVRHKHGGFNGPEWER